MLWLVFPAFAEELLVLEGDAPDDGLDHFFVPFEVPEGTVELQVHLDDGSSANVLDWGLNDPDGWRGWGGGNSEPAVLNAEAASRSYLPGPIVPGTWQVVVGKAKIDEPPGHYTIEVVLRDAVELPPQTDRQPFAAPAPLETTPRWYAGDFHVHSLESGDASASLDDIAAIARERGLDFVVITDHNTVSHLDHLVAAQARNPDVLFLPGMEFTTYDGHANALGVSAWVDHKIGQPGVTIEGAAEAFAAQGALLSINHPTIDLGDFCIGCGWDHPIVEPLAAMEIATGGLLQNGGLLTWSAIDLWESLVADGRRLAAIGGSDDHRAGIGLQVFQSPVGDPTTLVWADELSIDGILAGVASGRTVVKLQGPDDPFVELLVAQGEVSARITGGTGQTLRWWVDGVRGDAIPVDADPFEVALSGTGDREVRVRAEVHVDGGPRTITSNVWVPPHLVPPAEEAGCGCNGSKAAAVLPLLLVLGLRRRTARP